MYFSNLFFSEIRCYIFTFLFSADFVINFINEFWPAIYRSVLPIINKELEKFYIDIANRLFAKVSFSKVFP